MVQITHTGKNEEMLHSIMSVAQSRFGLYGLEKTSMQEIATDLGLSKGSLYYYFPDKQSLYIAVIEKELEQFFGIVAERLEKINDPAEKLRAYVQARQDHFRILLNLNRFRAEDWEGMKKLLAQSWIAFRAKEIALISAILNTGNKEAIFFIDNPDEVAAIFLDMLRGLRMALISKKDLVAIDPHEYDQLWPKINMFLEIFIKGLKNNK